MLPALFPMDLPGGQTHILDVHQIRRFDRHPVKCDDDSAPQSNPDTKNWVNWYVYLDNPNDSEDDCAADIKSDIDWDNGIDDPERP